MAHSLSSSAISEVSSHNHGDHKPTRLQSARSLRLCLNPAPDHDGTLLLPNQEALFGRNRVRVIKTNGWGFKDTFVYFVDKCTLTVAGKRYPVSGQRLQHWRDFTDSIPGLALEYSSPANPEVYVASQKVVNEDFLHNLRQKAPNVEVSVEAAERLFHGHGQTCHEVFLLRYGKIPRLPDVVLYPKCHQVNKMLLGDVEVIVSLASAHNVCLIPFGGGTSVTLGLAVPLSEKRMVASVSLSFMQKILHLDRDALLLHVEAGAVGAVLEEQLQSLGVTLGHEPDSFEFSTVGGWVATRASGMKKNAYGNIEDIVVDAVVVTPRGTLNQRSSAPRVSCGPSLQQLVLGSEGTLGIITQVTLKVKVLPEKKVYGCLAFPSFELGVAFLRHVAMHKLQPASIRLMDKMQTRCGSLFRTSGPGGTPLSETVVESLKKFYVSKIRGWKEEDLCACTLLFEGTRELVYSQQVLLYKAAKQFGALPAGKKNGERGYQLTFMIAYLRDFIMEHHWVFESFEASMPWTVVNKCNRKVHEYIGRKCKEIGVKYPPIVMTRLTQVYDGGAVLYFYFGFNWAGIEDPMEAYKCVEDGARKVIMECKGSISHHHGVGKLRKDFMPDALGTTGLDLLRGVKATVDPENIFGCKNLID